MEREEYKREHERQPYKDAFFLKLESFGPEGQGEGTTLHGTILDLSAGGLQMSVNRIVPVGCRIECYLRIIGRPGMLVIPGLIRWCVKDHAENMYRAGAAFLDEPCEDLDKLREALGT